MQLTFTCPHCGESHTIPADKIPGVGAWGKCHSCKNRIFVNGQGAFLSPPEENMIIRQGDPLNPHDSGGVVVTTAAAASVEELFSSPEDDLIVRQGDHLDPYEAHGRPNPVHAPDAAVEPPPQESFTFSCPHCNHQHAMPAGKVPEKGGWGKCHSCGEKIFVDGRGAHAEEKPREEGSEVYLLHTSTGEPAHFTKTQIVQRIKTKWTFPWDQISSDDEGFIQIQEHPVFADNCSGFFAPKSAHCCNHKDKVAITICSQCTRGYCGSCTKERDIGFKKIFVCPACWATLDKADLRWLEKPFWKDLVRIALFPIKNMGWVTTIGIGILFWMGGLFIPFSLVFLLLGFAYIVSIISESANGKKDVGIGPEASDVFDLISRGLIGVVVTLVIWIPIVLVNFMLLLKLMRMGPAGLVLIVLANIPLAIAGIIYYPMALGMIAVWDNKWIAFRPDIVVAHILKIKKDYTMVVLMMIITWLISFAAGLFLKFFPVLGSITAGILSAYFNVMWSHCLGWTLYLNEKKLGWD